MLLCAPWVRISDPIEVGQVWLHYLTCSEQGISAHTSEHMNVGFLSKRNMTSLECHMVK